jgi:hypothetical protein
VATGNWQLATGNWQLATAAPKRKINVANVFFILLAVVVMDARGF